MPHEHSGQAARLTLSRIPALAPPAENMASGAFTDETADTGPAGERGGALNEQVFEVVRTLTIRRRVPTGSLALLRETLARQTEIEGWEVLDAPEPQFHPVAVPLLGQHEPCIQVEYDEDFYGQGIHSADGDFAYIPQRLILALGIEVAFELVTGLDPVHILQWDESGDPLYTMTGDWWEEEENDTTSPLHEEQPVRVIHQGEHLGDTGNV